MYDRIGTGYLANRRPDPHWERRITTALGLVHSVVNVGAGTGSYEPRDCHVIAVEPSELMLSQRRPGAPAAVRAVAESLPFPARSFDAALAVLTVHHWHDTAAGLQELRRVARRQVVVTWDPRETGQFWLVEKYLPELLAYEHRLDPFDSLQHALHVDTVEPAMTRLAHDLETGLWQRRHQNLLDLDELDLGYKLVIASS